MALMMKWNFIGLSTEDKPTSGEKVVDGSTFFEVDTSKVYVWYKDQWYEVSPLATEQEATCQLMIGIFSVCLPKLSQ